ncbi:MAG TPA: DinB family protein [Chitinophagaceae bacterium]|nr:DinB family protein [Chitinophagaceae bacterium]
MSPLKYSIKTMVKDELQKEQLLALLEDTLTRFMEKLKKFSEVKINTIPFVNGWTAAQVADHLTKSNNSITKAMLLNGTYINRDPRGRVEELKAVFLDFNTKLKSPDFILPSQDIYEREVVIQSLEWSVKKLMEVGREADLSEMINHMAFGDITKFEILYFVHYHTQRHMHQLDKIFEAIKDR